MNIAANLSVALETPFLFFDENDQLLWQIGFQEDIEKHYSGSKMSGVKTNITHSDKLLTERNLYEQYNMNIAGQVQLTLVTNKFRRVAKG